jgi:hypothetical protein
MVGEDVHKATEWSL